MRWWLLSGITAGLAVAMLEVLSLVVSPEPSHPGSLPRPRYELDVLALALDRVEWGVSLSEAREAMDICTLSRGWWSLSRQSFRTKLYCQVAGIGLNLEFAGIAANDGTELHASETALVSVAIRRMPNTPRLPDDYVRLVNDNYLRRLQSNGLAFERVARGFGNERRIETYQSVTEHADFLYGAAPPSVEYAQITVTASDAVLDEFPVRETRAAEQVRDWPREVPRLEVCGNDDVWRRGPLTSAFD